METREQVTASQLLEEAYKRDVERLVGRDISEAREALKGAFEEITHPEKRAYLLALSMSPGFRRAAEAAGVHHTTAWAWRNGRKHESPEECRAFLDALVIAQKLGVEALEQEAFDWATRGAVEPVFGSLGGEKGENGAGIIGYKLTRSASMIQFMLKGNDSKYNTSRTELTGANGGPVESKVVMLPANDRDSQSE